jgi:hypothetical protein
MLTMRLLAAAREQICMLKPVTDMPSARFPAPLFLATGLADRTLSPYHQYAAVAALCAAGNPLEWKTYQGITHNGIVNTAFADELTFVQGCWRASRAKQLRDTGCTGKAQPALKDICITTDFLSAAVSERMVCSIIRPQP